MNGRANVVSETGKRQFCRARSTSHRVARFEDANGASGAGHFNTRGKTVRARPDDDCVELHRRIVYERIACFAPHYADCNGILRYASAEPTWTIVPRFRRAINRSAAIVPWTAPR